MLTQKAVQPTTLQAQTDGRGHQRHPVFPEEPRTKVRRYCHVGGGPKGAAAATTWPSCQTGPHSQRSQTGGRDCSHDEALWEGKEAHQWVLEAACMLELNIERLNKEADGVRCQHHCSHSHFQGRSLEQCVTFCKPEEGAPSDERPQTKPQEHFTRG